jgi:hypothetical protein
MDFVPYHNVSSRMRIGVFPKQEYKKRPIKASFVLEEFCYL